jgi:hypothetical protein
MRWKNQPDVDSNACASLYRTYIATARAEMMLRE